MDIDKIISEAQNALVDDVARKLLQIDMVNKPIISQVIEDTFGDVPLPENVGQRVMERAAEIRNSSE